MAAVDHPQARQVLAAAVADRAAGRGTAVDGAAAPDQVAPDRAAPAAREAPPPAVPVGEPSRVHLAGALTEAPVEERSRPQLAARLRAGNAAASPRRVRDRDATAGTEAATNPGRDPEDSARRARGRDVKVKVSSAMEGRTAAATTVRQCRPRWHPWSGLTAVQRLRRKPRLVPTVARRWCSAWFLVV